MAELVLSTVGQALGARLPGVLGSIGATLGRAAGAYIGSSIDQQLFGAPRRSVGAQGGDARHRTLHRQRLQSWAKPPSVSHCETARSSPPVNVRVRRTYAAASSAPATSPAATQP